MSANPAPQGRPRLYDSHAHLVSDDPVRYPRNGFVIKPKGDGGPAIRFPFGGGTIGIPGGMHAPPRSTKSPPRSRCTAGWPRKTWSASPRSRRA